MQYTTDLKNVYFHLSEDCARSVFPYYGIRYLFLTMKQLFSETFGRNFELFEELWMLTSRLLFRL